MKAYSSLERQGALCFVVLPKLVDVELNLH